MDLTLIWQVLVNCSVRRPTDLKSKGKYQSTCLRLDIDPRAQARLLCMHASIHPSIRMLSLC